MLPIIISEVYPDPVSPEVEWVEIYNDSSTSAEISNWRIRDCTETNSTIFSAAIPADSYYKIDNSKSFFNNSTDDCVRLFDQENSLIATNPLKPVPDHQSYSRQPDNSWCLSDPSPNFKNFSCLITTQDSSPTSTNSPQITLEITELNPDPDDGDEWLKIYNPNNFTVDLTHWHIIDQSQNSRTLSCGSIEANSTCYAFFSSGFLNNDGDSISLVDPSKRIISSYSYSLQAKTTSTKKPTATKKPTSTPKPAKTKTNSKSSAAVLGCSTTTFSCPQITPRPDSLLLAKKPNMLDHYLPISFMFIGSFSILWPFLFPSKK